MVRRDGAEVRRQRIHEIAQTILKALNQSKNGELSLSTTIINLQYETGLTKEKLVEYLEIMANMRQFVIDQDKDKIKKTGETNE